MLERSRTYYLYDQPCDMRKSFNTLSALVTAEMKLDLLTGSGFVFINKKRSHLKLLLWEGDGLSIYFKRLEKGSFEHPKISDGNYKINFEKLLLILQGIQTDRIVKRKRYKVDK